LDSSGVCSHWSGAFDLFFVAVVAFTGGDTPILPIAAMVLWWWLTWAFTAVTVTVAIN